MEKKKFTLIIKEGEKTCFEVETDCIMAAIHDVHSDSYREIAIGHCENKTTFLTTLTLDGVRNQILKQNPGFGAALLIGKLGEILSETQKEAQEKTIDELIAKTRNGMGGI